MTIYFGQNNNIFGFYDSELGNIPDGSIEITNDTYNKLLTARSKGAILSINNNSVIASNYDGTTIDLDNIKSSDSFIKPITLSTQAETALASARTYVYNNYGILNEATPDNWVTYIKALMAISNGTDTTSTVLPTQPTN